MKKAKKYKPSWKETLERREDRKETALCVASGAIDGAKDAAIILAGIGIFFAAAKYCENNA